jgi:hypothetical protein
MSCHTAAPQARKASGLLMGGQRGAFLLSGLPSQSFQSWYVPSTTAVTEITVHAGAISRRHGAICACLGHLVQLSLPNAHFIGVSTLVRTLPWSGSHYRKCYYPIGSHCRLPDSLPNECNPPITSYPMDARLSQSHAPAPPAGPTGSVPDPVGQSEILSRRRFFLFFFLPDVGRNVGRNGFV